jgi:ABC-2 type transport system ATP-binding protein
MPDPVVIRLTDVSKRFVIRKDKSLKERVVNRGRSKRFKEEFWALRDLSFDIEAGSSVGLIGANGSGKSTLLKAIGGIIQPTRGRVERRGRLAALLELGAGFHPDLTGRENVYLNGSILGLSQSQVARYMEAIVDFSGIEEFVDTQVKFYSSGMYVRLAFAVAVHVDPDVLLVDEVLAVGDEPFQRKCMDHIRTFQQEGRTIVLISHALEQVVEVCDRAIVLDHGSMLFDGAPREATRRLRQDFEETAEADQRKAKESDETLPDLKVDLIEVFDVHGKQVTEIRNGDELLVRMHIVPNGLQSDWVCGVMVTTPGGHVVWGTNTQLLGSRLGPIDRPTAVDFRLQNFSAGAGQYMFNGSIINSAGREIHRMVNGPQCTMTGNTPGIGLLGVNGSLASIT